MSASRIVSKGSSLMVKGGIYSTGVLVTNFCSIPGAVTRVGAVIRSFTVFIKPIGILIISFMPITKIIQK